MDRKWMPDQERALNEQNNLIVSASAGSGKTTVLIEKIFRLLKNGATLRKMAVMTFTDLAACELKDRLTDKLLTEIRRGGDVERLKAELEYLPFADVSTIHSFCKRLYKKYYAEIGEDFYEETLSGDEADALYKQCAVEAISEMRSRDEAEFDQTFWHFYGRDRGGAKLAQAIVELHKFLECVESKEEYIASAIKSAELPFEDKPVSKIFLEDLIARVAKLRVKLDQVRQQLLFDPGYKDNQSFIETLAVNVLTIANATSLKDLIKKAHTAKEVGLPNLKKAKIADDNLKEQLLRIKASYQDLLAKIYDRLTGYDERIFEDADMGRHVTQLLNVTKLAEEIYEKTKRQEGSIDFSDLEKLALKVLSDQDRLLEVCNGYEYIFLDEYQDTNYLQNKILTSISSSGKVFVVGDVKQSIYQFRYAEPAIFLDRYRNYEAGNGGVSIPFNDNFRSDPRILDFVNGVFSEIMTLSFGAVDYANKARFCAGLGEFPQVNDTPAVEVAVFPSARREKTSSVAPRYDIKEDQTFDEESTDEEAEYIATRIKKMLSGLLYDASNKMTRQAKLSDVSILVNTHSQAKQVSRVLTKRGISNYVHSGSGDEEFAEDRQFLFAYLRVLSNLHDDTSLAVVLLSPLTTFSEQDLVDVRGTAQDVPFWVSFINYQGAQTLKNKVDAFMALVNKHRALAATSNVRTLLEHVIKDFSYDAFIMGSENGDERIATLNMFLEAVSNAGASQDLTKFIQYVDSGAKWNVSPPSGGGDSVSIMTIHASKGLEYPVVFLPYAHYDVARRSGGSEGDKDFLIADRDYGVAIDYYDDEKKTKRRTLTGGVLEERKKKKELEERLRLMYVALTRAKNHLIVTFKQQSVSRVFAEENGTFAKWLLMAREANDALKKVFVNREESEASPLVDTELVPQPYQDDLELLEYQYPYKKETSTEVKYTVTSLMQDGERGEVIETEESEKVRLTGVAYHAILEKVDFHRVEKGDVQEVLDILTIAGEIREDVSKEIDVEKLSAILRLPVFDLARQSVNYREKGFMLYLPACEVVENEASRDKVLVQGVIDLLIMGKENVLVDYKYSSLSPEKLQKKYASQIKIYKKACEKLLKIKIDRTVIIALKSGKEIEIV